MRDRTIRWLYWFSTGLVVLVYLGGAAFYIFLHDMAVGMYENVLHYPAYLVWPLAILKIVGAVVILWRPSAMLADWAYASMFWHLVLAVSAHLAAGDPGWPPAAIT